MTAELGPTPGRCVYQYSPPAGQCLYNAAHGSDRCPLHPAKRPVSLDAPLSDAERHEMERVATGEDLWFARPTTRHAGDGLYVAYAEVRIRHDDGSSTFVCETFPDLAYQIVTAVNRSTALRAAERERDILMRHLEDLTPGGSEFFRSPERCRQWVQDRLRAAHEQAVGATKERRAAERENLALREALKWYADEDRYTVQRPRAVKSCSPNLHPDIQYNASDAAEDLGARARAALDATHPAS